MDGATTMKGFVVYDDTTQAKRPGVVMVHEEWCITKHNVTRQPGGRVTSRFNRLFIAALISSPALAETIIGQASVIDGDTLEIHAQRVRLSGIDASESDQLCRGDDSLQYPCGAKAANRPMSCKGSTDQYGRTVALCSIYGEDVASWLVRNGFAFDWPRYSKGNYAGAQKEEAERAGRWS